jgi:hypothetical protein
MEAKFEFLFLAHQKITFSTQKSDLVKTYNAKLVFITTKIVIVQYLWKRNSHTSVDTSAAAVGVAVNADADVA